MAEDQHAVGQREDLLDLAGDDDDGAPLGGEVDHEVVQLALGGDVDARVGSSTSSTRGSRSSHLAKSTFCWLPPESAPTGAVGSAARTSVLRATAPTASRLGAAAHHPRRGTAT
ncbi:MAG: hypothetical protein PGN11_14255 [Quadrisphaera sp.]